jgi:hypothetical protein
LNSTITLIKAYARLKKDKEAREAKKKKDVEESAQEQAKKKNVAAASNEFIKNIISNNAPLTSSKFDEFLHGEENKSPEK